MLFVLDEPQVTINNLAAAFGKRENIDLKYKRVGVLISGTGIICRVGQYSICGQYINIILYTCTSQYLYHSDISDQKGLKFQ